ncbi:MAG: hypothetical protein ACRDOK_10945 [Streptosporangiaceae bacterium]
MLGTPVASGRHGLVRRLGQAAGRPLHPRTRATGRRPWWKRVVIALLLVATVLVTVVYATTLARDIARQHWADALDASREAVLAVVGWAAVAIVLSAENDRKSEQTRRSNSATAGQRHGESIAGGDSVLLAQDRVRRLRVRLAELSAARERAGSGADPDLDREVASTAARLEKARQWLTSAQSARTAGSHDQHLERHPAGQPRAS